jgi:hypothetical protein
MVDSYTDIANLSWNDIPDVKTLPDGSWLLKARSASFKPSTDPEKSPVVMIVFNAKEPMDDVRSEDLEGLGKDYDVSANTIFHRIYIENFSDWKRVKDVLAKMGVDTEGKSVPDSLKEVKGKEIIAALKTRNFTRADGEPGEENNITAFVKPAA